MSAALLHEGRPGRRAFDESGFVVYSRARKAWLQADERSWGDDFDTAATFLECDLAKDIAAREACPYGDALILELA